MSFLEPNENTSPLEKVMRVLGECVYNGGYNVTSEIISFLSPDQLPIIPTRWKRDPEDIIARLRGELERSQEENQRLKDENAAARGRL